MNDFILLKLIYSFIVVIMLPVPSFPEFSEGKFLVVDGASNIIANRTLDGARTNIQYNIEVKYPNFAIYDKEWSLLEKLSWRKCSKFHEENLWFAYVENISNRRRLIHRHHDYWVKENTLLTVSMNYYSEIKNLKDRNNDPDNSNQQVVILFDQYGTSQVLGAVIRELELVCELT